jgi:hypothetical protein
VERAVSLAHVDGSTCALRSLIRADGSLDDTVILYDIPTVMGIDLAMLVRCDGGSRPAGGAGTANPHNWRLVAFQLHNTVAKSLNEIMLTLHPGAQYATNEQRQALIAGNPKGFLPLTTNVGAGSTAWKDFVALGAAYPALVSNWIRVAVVSQPVSEGVYEMAAQLAAQNVKRTMYETMFRIWLLRSQALVSDSPVVFVSLSASGWLDEGMRRAVLNVTEAPSTLEVDRSEQTWVSVPISEAEKSYLAALKLGPRR